MCEMDGGYLKVLFRTHGYCVDPRKRDGSVLPHSQVRELKNLAVKNGDVSLATMVETFETKNPPSPRMINDPMMNETTVSEKHRYTALDSTDQSQTCDVLMTILNIGMYLAGWKGPSEPYPHRLKVVSDVVRMDLSIDPLIRSLHANEHFAVVKNFPIVTYQSVKPQVAGSGMNLDECLNTVAIQSHRDYRDLSMNLISTAYYYITTICKVPVPMVQPLINFF